VKSETGNISWDGKNLGGKEVPEGTYFYIIKATGKDGKTEFLNDKGEKIPEQGTVSLYR
jgi:flagellar hook assembly protein FlgD